MNEKRRILMAGGGTPFHIRLSVIDIHDTRTTTGPRTAVPLEFVKFGLKRTSPRTSHRFPVKCVQGILE